MKRHKYISMLLLSVHASCFLNTHTMFKAASFYNDIYIVRHGETAWNALGKLQGHSDIPLNAEGERQAIQLGATLNNVRFSKVFSSDLARAQKTAKLIVGSTIITPISMLRERAMGIWEGCVLKELILTLKATRNLDALTKEAYLSYKFDESIENYAEVYTRVYEFAKSVTNQPYDLPLLFVSHGGVMRAILYTLDFKSGFRYQVGNTAYLKLRINNEGQWSIIEQNGIRCVPTEESTMPF